MNNAIRPSKMHRPPYSLPLACLVLVSTVLCISPGQAAEPQTLQSLLNNADAALYEAKASGRNRVQISGFSVAA